MLITLQIRYIHDMLEKNDNVLSVTLIYFFEKSKKGF